MMHLSRLQFVAIWLFCLALLSGLGSVTPQAYAQTSAPSAVQDVGATLDKTQSSVTGIQERLKNKPEGIDDTGLVAMRDTLREAQLRADEIATQLEPELVSIQARLKELGTPAPDTVEPPDIAQQRAQLTKQQSLLDSQVKLARLMGVGARQGTDQISLLRRARFQAELGTRSQSLLTASFWSDLVRDAPPDIRRVNGLLDKLGNSMKDTPTYVWSRAVVLALLLLLSSEIGRRSLATFTVRHTKPARLRRSIFAVLTVALYTLVPALLATILLWVLRWKGNLDADLNTFLEQCTVAIYLGGFVGGLGMALLAPARPSWRLPALTDRLAKKLGWVPVVFAITIASAWAAQRLLELINASLSTTLFVNGVMTVILNILIGFTALSLRSSLRKQAHKALADESQAGSPVAAWARAMPSVLVFVIWVSLAAFLLGFIALSSLVAQEIIWLALVGSTAYLLLVLVADIFDSMVAKVGVEQVANVLTEQQARTRCQLLVLMSGTLRLVLVIFAISLVLLPFGENPGDWLQRRLGFVTAGFKVGEVQIKPISMMLTMAVLLAGVYAVRVLRSWISDQFLPVTRLDESMRTSAANLLSYLGYFAVIMMAMSSLGIGLERMAWIVSALSVGIGFGLQAVVQNFVSGMILVAERPIKVGDWVSLDGVEGNVRKISARATEIEMFDRSTMIVPNSEFITKKVRNVTMANPLGVVSLKFNMPLNVNADVVRDIMMAAMLEQPDILDKPAPLVMLEAFSELTLTFSATCYVISPRNVSRMRSELMFQILGALRKRDIKLQPMPPPSADVAMPAPTGGAAPTPPDTTAP
ncbi:MAG: mechanosensitive ion channel family protein [Burkholderiaceae bacterium]|nr:mechanosensitive ion channel family protein [Burkholderiaceae bacterium]